MEKVVKHGGGFWHFIYNILLGHYSNFVFKILGPLLHFPIYKKNCCNKDLVLLPTIVRYGTSIT